MKQSWLKQLLMAIFMLPSMYAVSYAAEESAQFTPRAASGNWLASGVLVTARYFHTATKLVDGTVLVVGGYGVGDAVLPSVERYNPNTGGMIAPPPVLTTGRSMHTATLLSPTCGNRVLIVGGTDGSGAINNAVMYTPGVGAFPAPGTWISAGTMSVGRYGHTATLLPGGCRVLIAGGTDENGISLNSAEIYDATLTTANPNGTWSNTGNLANARTAHTATLLTGGKVLVAGGSNPAYVAISEIYTISTGTWSRTGSLIVARDWHTATTFMDGVVQKVLVVGGSNSGRGGSLSSAEIYDPTTNVWTVAASIPGARTKHATVYLPNNDILVTGGNNNDVPVANSQIYDPSINTWRNAGTIAGITGPRWGHSAVLLDVANPLYGDFVIGRVFVVGGSNVNATTSTGAPLPTTSLYLPTAVTLAPVPGSITLNTATLNGRVNTWNADDDSRISFDFGTNINYGSLALVPLPAGNVVPGTPDAIKTVAIGGLNCGNRYNNRIKVEDNGTGSIVYGGNNVFNTAACNRTDLKLLINHGPAVSVNAGGAVIYTVSLDNLGPSLESVLNVRLRSPAVNHLTINNTIGCVAIGGAVCPIVRTVALLQDAGLVIPTLPKNGRVTFTITGAIANSAPTQNLIYRTNITYPTNRFVDISPSNNVAQDSIRVIGLATAPDLMVESIVLTPASPAADTSFAVTVKVKNIGTAASAQNFLDVWANQPAAVACGAMGNDWVLLDPIPRGGSVTQTLTIPADATGLAGTNRILRAFVDSQCVVVTEPNEANNQKTLSYTVH